MIIDIPQYMQFSNIHFIINPAAGKEEPILSYLCNTLKDTEITWKVTVPTEKEGTYHTARELVGKTDVVVVYGGDGSVAEVAKALRGTDTPLAIIPGGTANVLSKELGIPQDTQEALQLLISGQVEIKPMDMGEANGTPFLLRINLGIMADMILNADAGLKSTLGQLAYGVSALKTTIASEPIAYNMVIDGETVTQNGVSLTVTNAGSIGIGEMSFLPGISVSDGYFDVLLLQDAKPLSMLQIAGSTLFQQESDALKHWRCKDITIKLNKNTKFICDDCEMEANEIDIKVFPLALKMLVPIK